MAGTPDEPAQGNNDPFLDTVYFGLMSRFGPDFEDEPDDDPDELED